ncbi:hypothetical protein JKF63_01972 [Porcisia hertigi]|uniref:Uncharacterized protein n=1 Tax=Porcisia hertigi TaxID=2761500 RepID=A0A836L1V0_9TRYP|nr:hypothetical protein JKF63_01972 [Porcisia hertigi]
MESNAPVHAESREMDPLLERLQNSYTRQKRRAAAQTRRRTEHELKAAAAYHSDLPVNLELLSDDTACLFEELQLLLEPRHGQRKSMSREVALLQRIRVQVNREMRASLSCIEQGYTSGFEKLLHTAEKKEPPAPLAKTSAPLSTAAPARNSEPGAAESPAKSSTKLSPTPSHLALREVFSGFISVMAESLAVLLQCEVVRVYLYDTHACLQCVAQFPYRVKRANPMHSNHIAMMAAREVHDIVCQERLAVNGWLSRSQSANYSSDTASEDGVEGKTVVTGLEDIRTCLLLPIFSPQGVGKAYGMIHAVNKQCPTTLGIPADASTEVPHLGFNADDETLASSVARVIGTVCSRYPPDFFSVSGAGEKFRRMAFPGDAEVLSLTAHLPPVLQDEVKEAAEVAQLALTCLTPILVYRVPMESLYEKRLSEGNGQRRKLSIMRSREGTVSSVEFNLRCMNELWEKSRGDNVVLHTQYRVLEEKVHRTQLLLRNILDGVATARAMPLSTDVAQYLHNLEMYGRSERTERMAAYVSEQMLAIPASTTSKLDSPDPSVKTPISQPASSAERCHMGDSELRALQRHHARLNTVTPASLHFEGPSGVRSYTTDPVQKRQQVRFIDELCRLAEKKTLSHPSARRENARRSARPSSLPGVSHGAPAKTPMSSMKRNLGAFEERPFKL